MDWFKGKSTGNHRFSHQIWGFPVNFPLNQSIETKLLNPSEADELPLGEIHQNPRPVCPAMCCAALRWASRRRGVPPSGGDGHGSGGRWLSGDFKNRDSAW